METITGQTTIGEIVRSNFKTTPLFEKHRIDFCCGGEKTVNEVCARHDLDPEKLISEVSHILLLGDGDSIYYNNLSPAELINYITRRHHQYLNESIPQIHARLEKLIRAHAQEYPELEELKETFETLSIRLSNHMKKEELLLFPLIRAILRASRNRIRMPEHIAELPTYLDELKKEHRQEGNRMDKIALLTGRYTPPPGTCHTMVVTYHSLQEFERDLHRHMHLENNILFPKAIQLIDQAPSRP